MGISDSVSCIAWRIGEFILCRFNFFFLDQGLGRSRCHCSAAAAQRLASNLELRSSCLHPRSSGYRWEGTGPFSFSRTSSFRKSPLWVPFFLVLCLFSHWKLLWELRRSSTPPCSQQAVPHGKHPFIFKPGLSDHHYRIVCSFCWLRIQSRALCIQSTHSTTELNPQFIKRYLLLFSPSLPFSLSSLSPEFFSYHYNLFLFKSVSSSRLWISEEWAAFHLSPYTQHGVK